VATNDLLDICGYRPRGVMNDEQRKDDLIQYILDEVKSTQSLVIQPLPNIVLMRRDQFDTLRPSAEFVPTDALIWKVMDPPDPMPFCMMDIHVKGEFEPKPDSLLLLS
jgi:hypothetical protein